MAETIEHTAIWLAPRCRRGPNDCKHPDAIETIDGRLWCQDNVWRACAKCGAAPVRYILDRRTGRDGRGN